MKLQHCNQLCGFQFKAIEKKMCLPVGYQQGEGHAEKEKEQGKGNIEGRGLVAILIQLI